MPQIIVASDRGAAFGQGAVTLREGVTVADFESQHFATQLVERLGWAVEDADQLEQSRGEPDESTEDTEELELVRDERAEPAEPAEHVERIKHVERIERDGDREPVTAR
jgi:hypothetical protein